MNVTVTPSAWTYYPSTASTTSSTGHSWTSTITYTRADMERAFFEGGAMAAPVNKYLDKAETYHLPDGSELVIDAKGNYRIDDSNARVTYQANRIRDFSPHVNASDMLAEFVKYAGAVGVRRDEVLGLPIKLFISWLIIQAAERDGDEIPDDVTPLERAPELQLAVRPKCLACNRFIKRLYHRNRFDFCCPEHAAWYAGRQQPALAG